MQTFVDGNNRYDEHRNCRFPYLDTQQSTRISVWYTFFVFDNPEQDGHDKRLEIG